MADAKRRDQWSHTAAALAMTANVHRDRKKKSQPFTPADFHPLARRKTPAVKVGLGVLKQVFVENP